MTFTLLGLGGSLYEQVSVDSQFLMQVNVCQGPLLLFAIRQKVV